MGFRLFLTIEAVHVLQSLRAMDKRRLNQRFVEIQESPYAYSDRQGRDTLGRLVEYHQFGNLLIAYWIDEMDRDIKVLTIQRIKAGR